MIIHAPYQSKEDPAVKWKALQDAEAARLALKTSRHARNGEALVSAFANVAVGALMGLLFVLGLFVGYKAGIFDWVLK